MIPNDAKLSKDGLAKLIEVIFLRDLMYMSMSKIRFLAGRERA